ncbi:uncharacterized protein LOC131224790 isoform X3 [Magnolia sinica]|uniref:uncharacterized protein LOC131224790 isoform X3 n=1 Tax=Magnolia sinica TaxID=86752 RepID=UPI00265A1664|nr:uncharacterized protein LOC131224790 isoform X3 [Magnolia sinica]XP_058076157.1 uncharacterized protein LOC131224790 isoform X3 [Magnolia sinica]
MQVDDARELLGFSSDSHPTPSQIKAAYRRKAWESHPDRFPAHEKSHAESKFKSISEAYSCLQADLLILIGLTRIFQFCLRNLFEGFGEASVAPTCCAGPQKGK